MERLSWIIWMGAKSSQRYGQKTQTEGRQSDSGSRERGSNVMETETGEIQGHKLRNVGTWKRQRNILSSETFRRNYSLANALI